MLDYLFYDINKVEVKLFGEPARLSLQEQENSVGLLDTTTKYDLWAA